MVLSEKLFQVVWKWYQITSDVNNKSESANKFVENTLKILYSTLLPMILLFYLNLLKKAFKAEFDQDDQ